MKITSSPKVFERFSADVKSASVSFAKNEDDKSKGHDASLRKKGFFRLSETQKYGLGAFGIVAAASFVIPAIRNKLYKDVNPGLIDISKKGAKSKRNYIFFADQVKAKRDLTFKYFADTFGSIKEIIRRNFFSYNRKEPAKLTPVLDFPKKLVECATNQVFRTAEYLQNMFKHVNVDYSRMTKS